MVSFAWVAGRVAVVTGLAALSEFRGARWCRQALLRRPPQEARNDAPSQC
jgi:hypothetical protein